MAWVNLNEVVTTWPPTGGVTATVGDLVWTVDTFTELRAIATTDVDDISAIVRVGGGSTVGDGGGGDFYWDATSSAADDGFSIILPTGYTGTGRWKRVEYWDVTDAIASDTDILKGYCSRGYPSSISVLVLGDSITEGTGATTYTEGYSWILGRSIFNAVDQGYPRDRGYGYHSIINIANAMSDPGITTNGTYSAAGVVGSRLSLAAGQAITITGRAIAYVDVLYDSANSTGSLVVALDGTTISTTAVTAGTDIKALGLKQLTSDLQLISESSSVTITASGGTIVVTGVLTLRVSSGSPLVYVVGDSGTAYQDYTSTADLDEMAVYLNLYRTSNPKLLILNLGTNNLYNAGKSKIPSAMVTEIGTVIAGITSRCTGVVVAIAVPPQSNESVFPIIASGYTYSDYVRAIVDYARANGYALIRHDLSKVSDHLSDSVHPNSNGHLIMAGTVCEALGIPVNAYNKTTKATTGFPKELGGVTADITMNDTWRPYTNNTAFKATVTKQGNVLFLSGIVEPNGSVSTTVGTLPAAYRPVGRTCYILTRDDAGVETMIIDTLGVIAVTAVPVTWLSLENIAIVVER